MSEYRFETRQVHAGQEPAPGVPVSSRTPTTRRRGSIFATASVGIEHIEDLKEDIDQALEAVS